MLQNAKVNNNLFV